MTLAGDPSGPSSPPVSDPNLESWAWPPIGGVAAAAAAKDAAAEAVELAAATEDENTL